MSNEIERMFASLSADADSTPLMPSTVVRTRTDRRAAAQAGLAGFALVAVVAGTAFGGQWLLAGQGEQLPPPGGTGSATPSAATAPSVTPSVPQSSPPTSSSAGTSPAVPATGTSPTSPARAIPRSIPARAFLSKKDLNDDTGVTTPSDGGAPLPSFCKATFASNDTVGVRRTLRALYRRPGTPVTNVPDGVLRQTITVHRADGAEEFMADLRAAVRGCRTETDDQGDRTARYRLINPVGVGDDSVRIEEKTTGAAAPDSDEQAVYTQQISVVRVGDAVTIIWTGGYENDSAIDSTVVALTRAAHRNVANWRN